MEQVRVITTQKPGRRNYPCIIKGHSVTLLPHRRVPVNVYVQTVRKGNITVNSLGGKVFRTGTEKSPLPDVI